MASNSIQAEQHRQRQAYRPDPKVATDKDGNPLHVNTVDWIHGSIVTNRKERRAALAVMRKFRCTGSEHGSACPKYVKPSKAKAA